MLRYAASFSALCRSPSAYKNSGPWPGFFKPDIRANLNGIFEIFRYSAGVVNRTKTESVREALPPIISLIGKSEKARQKLKPGTWQHAMLQDNLHALHIAHGLMTNSSEHWTQKDLDAAARAFDSMIGRTEPAQTRFSPGTPQHTLLKNRLNALRLAKDLIINQRF